MKEYPKSGMDLVIKEGLIFDGTGVNPFRSNIGISGDKIVDINQEPHITQKAKKIVDAKGLAVAPGYIDTHGHSEFTLLADPRAEGKLLQGVTTEINGNCGLSAAPLSGEALRQRKGDLRELGISKRWSNFDEYFRILGKSIAINFATLVGHGNVRASVIGYEDRVPDKVEKDKMKRLLLEAITQGAIGISTGLAYPPGVYSETEELIELCRVLSRFNKSNRNSCKRNDKTFLRKNDIKERKVNSRIIFTSHMRDEGDGLVESIEEIIRIGRESGIKVHISHIKTSGKHNWSKIDKVISMIKEARREGICITCDRYPYNAASTDLDTLLPSWVYAGGIHEEIKKLKNSRTREKIKEEVLNKYPEREFWEQVRVATVYSERNRWIEGKSIASIARCENYDPVDIFLKILIEEELRVSAIFSTMSEDNLQRFLSLPYVMIGTDSAARSTDGLTNKGKPHPRGFGTFPRFLGRYVRDKGLMNLSNAIHKVTMLPAQTFGIEGRGIIKKGAFADLVVFDHKNIIDRATFEEPFLKNKGLYYIIVNGVPALWEGKITGECAGKILRHGV